MNKLGKHTWEYTQPIYIQASGTAVGPEELQGPLGTRFDQSYSSLYCGETSFLKAERVLMNDAIQACLHKSGVRKKQIDYFIAGDLDHQLTASAYTARDLELSFLGMYAACATAIQSIIMSSLLIETKLANYAIAGASSHFGVAENQFRYPTEFAVQKQQSAQYTVTGAGAVLLSRQKSPIKITSATIGQVIDMGLKDTTNLGAVMAPAAGHTLLTHLRETERSLSDYDLILTGDLGRIGSNIFRKWMREHGYPIDERHEDGGVKIFRSTNVFLSGGSGAGCVAVVTIGYVLEELQKGTFNRVLVLATGALFSQDSARQGDTIPAVAHAVSLERVKM
ncbi:stage V sporulation protein AD [Alkalicoccobacillus murimartini]|uniref:Stage V sporulation protein AD n=1 Tax=Alkalicoccobacillus murimartini TaxID=171685 RepID=A0ABT9YD85_9BACI|nr:stage V sporulation protein AD [Alkalicoccobacillus murimartini]MDQ0205805.1 stage V sporulation protein AD [Alkalicoccobacillus murimartini]